MILHVALIELKGNILCATNIYRTMLYSFKQLAGDVCAGTRSWLSFKLTSAAASLFRKPPHRLAVNLRYGAEINIIWAYRGL